MSRKYRKRYPLIIIKTKEGKLNIMESLILNLTIKPSSICIVSPPAAIKPITGLANPRSRKTPPSICNKPVIFR